MPVVDDYFRIALTNGERYPDARPDRLLFGAGLIPPARARIVPFGIAAAASRRATASTPRLHGPAILQRIALNFSASATPVTVTGEVGYARNPVSEDGALLTTLRPYIVLTELQDIAGQVDAAAGNGFPSTPTITGAAPWERTINYVSTELEVAFVIALVNSSAGVVNLFGHLTVLEQVPLAALAGLL